MQDLKKNEKELFLSGFFYSLLLLSMPARIVRDVLVIDQSELACNMYSLLFTPQVRFRARIADEYESLFKRSVRLRPDLILINSNSIPKDAPIRFPCPTIMIISRDRFDLKERVEGMSDVVVIEKPFYPFDLISVANSLLGRPKGKKRGRKRKLRE